MNPEELKVEIERILTQVLSAPGEDYAEAVPEAVAPDTFDGVDRDTYQEAMEMVFDEYDVPEEMREQVYEQLDAHGDYSSAGYIENLTIVLDNDTINTHIDNGITVEEGAEVRNIHQQNETNVANATGEGAIAGRDQDGQFQTGDGQQVGDYATGPNVQGDTSGQVAGGNATADDITTGDGNFNNDGTIDDSAIAFGGGAADNTANDVDDYSINDSFNTDDAYNTDGSFNTEGSLNTEETYTSTESVDATLDADVTGSFNSDDDHHDVDNSHNIHEDDAPEEMLYES